MTDDLDGHRTDVDALESTGKALSDEQQTRLIDDLARWKIEYEDFDIADDELVEWRTRLEGMNDHELRSTWRSCVGEWLCSRSDLPVDEMEGEEFVDLQLHKLLAGERTDYGYVA